MVAEMGKARAKPRREKSFFLRKASRGVWQSPPAAPAPLALLGVSLQKEPVAGLC